MAVMDDNAQYLPHIPRLESYLRAGLNDPILSTLKAFFESQKVDFSGLGDFNSSAVKTLIRSDAY